jgi:predicted AlkP superfamily pyrophosphatase or phosphodiesterase
MNTLTDTICSASETASSEARVHLFVLIDALGWELLKEHQFLNDILSHRQPLRTVLGFSSGAIPTILTGLPPAKTGHWNLFYYDPQGSPFRWLKWFQFLPDFVLDHRVTQKILKELGRHVLGMGPLFECFVSPRLLPWFNWVEKRNIYERRGISGAPSIFDNLDADNVRYKVYSYHHQGDREILEQATRDVESDQATFYFIYLCEVDSLLHNHILDKDKLAERLDHYAEHLRNIFYRAQRVDPNASMTLFSDHGMTPVTDRFDVAGEIEGLGFSMPDDYLAIYDSTMARFWFFNPESRTRITQRLGELGCGRILSDLELQELGVFFPDQRYGEIVFLLHPGWLISHSEFNGKGWNPIGMHGYHPDDAYSDGVFLGSEKPPFPVHTVADVYQCLREALPTGRHDKL